MKSVGRGLGMEMGARCLRELPDYLRPGLRLVFVGFNPSEYSCRAGHYYASPGNPFWSFLYEAGLVPERLSPQDDYRLLEFGIGITDIVKRCSRSSSDLGGEDYRLGAPMLREKLERAAPKTVAFNGKGVWEKFTGRPSKLGPQQGAAGGARVFVLPSTSRRNARLTHEQKLDYFRTLADWVSTDA
ncbi:MAG TPA: mismatch-specific DNA-glycosylase [Terriglobia bacterium]|nr:mismatch-specific DNA-glycosylase [Terriglobia bacterium]